MHQLTHQISFSNTQNQLNLSWQPSLNYDSLLSQLQNKKPLFIHHLNTSFKKQKRINSCQKNIYINNNKKKGNQNTCNSTKKKQKTEQNGELMNKKVIKKTENNKSKLDRINKKQVQRLNIYHLNELKRQKQLKKRYQDMKKVVQVKIRQQQQLNREQLELSKQWVQLLNEYLKLEEDQEQKKIKITKLIKMFTQLQDFKLDCYHKKVKILCPKSS